MLRLIADDVKVVGFAILDEEAATVRPRPQVVSTGFLACGHARPKQGACACKVCMACGACR